MLHSDTSEDASPEEERAGLFSGPTSPEYAGRTPSPSGASYGATSRGSDIPLTWDETFESRATPFESMKDQSDFRLINTNDHASNISSKPTDEKPKERLPLKNDVPENFRGKARNDIIKTEKVTIKVLPPGWERHEDANGGYYFWHIPSGSIQRREPTPPAHSLENNNIADAAHNTAIKISSPSVSKLSRDTPSPLSTNSTRSSSSQRLRSKTYAEFSARQHPESRNSARSHSSALTNHSPKRPGAGDPLIFTVISLGWVHVPGEQLSQSELSSHVVEECIKELRKEATEEFGFDTGHVNGNGQHSRHLQLVLYDDCICVIDHVDNRVLSHQPLYLVRVWGTTRTALYSSSSEDGNSPTPTPLFPISTFGIVPSLNEPEYLEYFAFVARDRYSKSYFKCFVYRCVDAAAAQITHALNLKCEAYLQQYYNAKSVTSQNTYADDSNILLSSSNTNGADRPKSLIGSIRPSLSMQQFSSQPTQASSRGLTDFLTPMQEPRKIVDNIRYVGSMPVPNSTGINETNNVINMLVEESRLTHGANELVWAEVIVEVSPSVLAIRQVDKDADEYYDDDGYGTTAVQSPSTFAGESVNGAEATIIECRIRYLSFLGISRDDPHFCGFVIVTPDDAFVCHVVYGEQVSNIAHLCKTVEAACTLRYQKFLDAHTTATPTVKSEEQPKNRARATSTNLTTDFGAKLRGLFSTSWTSLLSPSASSAPAPTGALPALGQISRCV